MSPKSGTAEGGRGHLESPAMARSGPIGAGGTRALSVAIILIGVAILIRTLIEGGGVLSFGIVIGVLFLALGAGRLYLSLRAPG